MNARVVNLLDDGFTTGSDSDDDLGGWVPAPEYDGGWDDFSDPWGFDSNDEPSDAEDDEEESEVSSDVPQADGVRHPSDIVLAERALSGNYFTVLRDSYTCRCRQNCGNKITVSQCFELLDDMWGDYPTTNLRRERMFQLLRTSWDIFSKRFRFIVSGNEVCEKTFRMCVGIGPQSTMWKRLKTLVKDGGDLTEREAPRKQNVNTKKIDRMTRWITNFADESCDRLPINDKGGLVQFVIPFLSVSEFFGEYQADSEENVGGAKTFSRAFNDLPHIRTMRCKGNFSTCAICDAASKLLANVKRERRLSALEKQVISNIYVPCPLDVLIM